MITKRNRTQEEIDDRNETMSAYIESFYDSCKYCGINNCNDCAPGW